MPTTRHNDSAAPGDQSRGGPSSPGAAAPLVPVFRRDALGYPEHDGRGDYDAAVYAPLEAALTTSIGFDAHTTAYACPSIARRLAKVGALALGPVMHLFVVDIDDAVAHEMKRPKRPEWQTAERPKIDRLLEAHPGAYVFGTRGGYRLVYRLAELFVLHNRDDARRWTGSYLRWLDEIRTYDIVDVDEGCADWTRLYRLPRVVRDGVAVVPDFELGDPHAVGLWHGTYVDIEPEYEYEPIDLEYVAPPEDKVMQAVLVLGQSWPRRGRHFAHRALAGALARRSWPVEQIAQFAEAVAWVQDRHNADYSKRLKDATSAINAHAAGCAEGWTTLARRLGENGEAAWQAARLLGVERLPQPDPDLLAMFRRIGAEQQRAREQGRLTDHEQARQRIIENTGWDPEETDDE